MRSSILRPWLSACGLEEEQSAVPAADRSAVAGEAEPPAVVVGAELGGSAAEADSPAVAVAAEPGDSAADCSPVATESHPGADWVEAVVCPAGSAMEAALGCG